MKKPRVFWVHFNRLNARRGDADVCTVHLSDRCLQVKKAIIRVSTETVFKGLTAPQPRFYCRGVGIVRVKHGIATITRT